MAVDQNVKIPSNKCKIATIYIRCRRCFRIVEITGEDVNSYSDYKSVTRYYAKCKRCGNDIDVPEDVAQRF